MVYKEDYEFKIGKGIKLMSGKDISIFCTGRMVHNSLEAAKLLKEQNISASVINIHTIKPIDKKLIEEANNTKAIFSGEEHNVIGLGSAIAEHNSTIRNSVKHIRLGVQDTYSVSGGYDYLQKKHGLSAINIVESVIKNLSD